MLIAKARLFLQAGLASRRRAANRPQAPTSSGRLAGHGTLAGRRWLGLGVVCWGS